MKKEGIVMEEKLSKYEWVKREIQEKIKSHEWKANQVIPSENKLCQQYNVSRITIRRAMDELVHEGILYRIKGKGCFVREQSSDKFSYIYSFTEAVKHQGKTPSRKQLYFEKEKAGKEYAAKMGIDPKDDVYVLKCLYFADGLPYCVSTSVMPAVLFPKLEFFDFNKNSLYEVLKTFYQLSMTRVQQTIVAETGSKEINTLLDNEKNRPLLEINAVSRCLYENHERVFEVYQSYILTDILSYNIEKYNM